MSPDNVERPEDVAFRLVGWVEAGLHRGFLGDSPAWWVDGIRERIARLDIATDRANAFVAARLAELGAGQ